MERRIREAVARVAATEPDPLDPFRGLYISDEGAMAAAGEASLGGAEATLGAAVERLRLAPLDALLLALVAAPELDGRFGKLIAYLHDDATRRLTTPRLAARLLAGPVSERRLLERFGADAPLRATGAVRLLDDDPLLPLADRPAKLEPRLAAHLIGAPLGVEANAGGERLVRVPAVDPGRAATVEELRRILANRGGMPLVVAGSDAGELLATALGRAVLLVDARDGADPERHGSARVRAALEGATVVFELPEQPSPEERERVRSALAAHGSLACTRRREELDRVGGIEAMVVEVPPPAPVERGALWAACTGADPAAADDVAARFRLSIRQIEHAARLARIGARAGGSATPSAEDLARAAREASRTRLGELARLLDARREWRELILPDAQRAELRSISAYLRHRDLVLGDWGYGEVVASQGLKVLFAGPSGTGKTLAAQVVAGDLGVDVFSVDLATVVSKYIGETERNLDRIFAAAEGSNAILFFDEADALFGKRSEVKDAHDRYANIEVAYLLQRMESYPGAVVLATNYRRNVDEAFLRRLDFAIDFPFPEAAERAQIWRRLLPASAPLADDVDPDALAASYELSGGSIRNCSVAAAFMAADDGARVGMRHLVRAVAAEYRKNGRLMVDGDFPGDAAYAQAR